jgi:hypothetical protein
MFTGLSVALRHNLVGTLPPAFSGIIHRVPYQWSEFGSQSIFVEFTLFEGMYKKGKGKAIPVQI